MTTNEVPKSSSRLLLPCVALVALCGVIGLASATWVVAPSDLSVVSGVIVFLENVVVAIVGYYTGQSLPESRND